eukprot:548264-Pleurochrysis_carterae.AAC.1
MPPRACVRVSTHRCLCVRARVRKREAKRRGRKLSLQRLGAPLGRLGAYTGLAGARRALGRVRAGA